MRKLLPPTRVSIAGYAIRVDGARADLRDLLGNLWPTRTPHPRGSLHYTVARTSAGTYLRGPERDLRPLSSPDRFELHRLLLEDVFGRLDDAFALHGACVSGRGRAMLISGPSGFGKTTLAIHLALSGFRFLADDLVLVDRLRGGVEPVRRGVHLRPGSRALLAPGARERARRAARHRGRTEWTVDPDRWLGAPPRCAGIGLVLLLRPAEDLHRVRRLHAFDLVFAAGRRRLPRSLAAIDGLQAVRRSSDGRRWRVEATDPERVRRWIEGRPDGLRAWAKGAQGAPRFDGAPAAAPVGRFQAAIELAQEMVNRGPGSRLAERYSGREEEIAIDLAERIADARCWALVPGRLQETLDLVRRLSDEASISPRPPGRAAPR